MEKQKANGTTDKDQEDPQNMKIRTENDVIQQEQSSASKEEEKKEKESKKKKSKEKKMKLKLENWMRGFTAICLMALLILKKNSFLE